MQQSFLRRAPLLFWVRSLPSETGKEFVETGKQLVNQSVAGTDKLGILGKAQLFDHIGCNVLRFQDPDLTFDPGGIRLVDRRPGFAVTCPFRGSIRIVAEAV